MKRSISSALTFYFKIILPALWIPFLAVWITMMSSAVTANSFPLDRFVFLLIWTVAVVFICRLGVGLKTVSIDKTTLYVSNYRKEIAIPLDDIQGVTENVWINIHPVTIHLKSPSAFGGKIKFMPEYRFFAWYRSHPIVEELIKSVKSNQLGLN